MKNVFFILMTFFLFACGEDDDSTIENKCTENNCNLLSFENFYCNNCESNIIYDSNGKIIQIKLVASDSLGNIYNSTEKYNYNDDGYQIVETVTLNSQTISQDSKSIYLDKSGKVIKIDDYPTSILKYNELDQLINIIYLNIYPNGRIDTLGIDYYSWKDNKVVKIISNEGDVEIVFEYYNEEGNVYNENLIMNTNSNFGKKDNYLVKKIITTGNSPLFRGTEILEYFDYEKDENCNVTGVKMKYTNKNGEVRSSHLNYLWDCP